MRIELETDTADRTREVGASRGPPTPPPGGGRAPPLWRPSCSRATP
jgi:hypothetical protein